MCTSYHVFSILLSSKYPKRNMVVSVIFIEKAGLSYAFIFVVTLAISNIVYKYIQSRAKS